MAISAAAASRTVRFLALTPDQLAFPSVATARLFMNSRHRILWLSMVSSRPMAVAIFRFPSIRRSNFQNFPEKTWRQSARSIPDREVERHSILHGHATHRDNLLIWIRF